MSGTKWSHRPKVQSQIKDETRIQAKPSKATPSGVLGQCLEPPAALTQQLTQPLPTTNPEHPTHWEPPGSMRGAHLPDSQSQQVDRPRFPPGGRRPIVARPRRADGRAYGPPVESDLRSFAVLSTGVRANSAMHFGGFTDIRGMREKSAQPERFFTERTLAAYLAVSDRTIRNWIRRGELPSYKLGAARRINPADVEDFLARNRDAAA